MRIKIQLFVLIFFLLSSNSIAEKINSIDVVGNERISKDTIILFSKISENDEIIKQPSWREAFERTTRENGFKATKKAPYYNS